MRFIYGKQDWKTFERGEETCYLMTNGLGGFSSLSLIGSCSRNDQAVFMACTHSPNHRYNMVHRLEEIFAVRDKRVYLSSQDFAQASMNWIAEGINVVGQGAFLVGVWMLHKAGLGEKDSVF